MKPIDIILLIIIALALFVAVMSLIRRQRKGVECCNCPGSSICGRAKKKSCDGGKKDSQVIDRKFEAICDNSID